MIMYANLRHKYINVIGIIFEKSLKFWKLSLHRLHLLEIAYLVKQLSNHDSYREKGDL